MYNYLLLFIYIVIQFKDIIRKGDIVKMLVTCYYDIYNKPEKIMDYIYLFYDLGTSGIPIIVFTDPELVSKFRIFPYHVKVIGIPLKEFELYSMGMKYDRELPTNRTKEKDTKEFYSLMNTKMEFIKKAKEYCNDETFIWIDFGILKIVKNKDRFLSKLREVNERKYNKMTIPGCWSFGRAMSVEMIHWRFCGGFFVMPRKYIDRFYEHSKNVLKDFCTMSIYKLTWETNVWSVIESCAEKDNIDWYFADHNDTMVMNIDTIKSN
jgi:hypothetical protein